MPLSKRATVGAFSLAVIALASCNEDSPNVAKLKHSHLYYAGANCAGEHFAFAREFLLIGKNNELEGSSQPISFSDMARDRVVMKQVYGPLFVNIEFLFKGNQVIMDRTNVDPPSEPQHPDSPRVARLRQGLTEAGRMVSALGPLDICAPYPPVPVSEQT